MTFNIYSLKYHVLKKINYFIFKNFFKRMGKNVNIIAPLKIQGFKNIILEDNVVIQYKTWLCAKPINLDSDCILHIGKGTNIGHFNHIYATQKILIGDDVLTADKVYISDNLHQYQNPFIPIIKQEILQISPVEIGDGTWIGENAVILGAKIGKNCVVGANSFVNKDIPNYSVAVGTPANVIKRFDVESKAWRKTNKNGDFL